MNDFLDEMAKARPLQPSYTDPVDAMNALHGSGASRSMDYSILDEMASYGAGYGQAAQQLQQQQVMTRQMLQHGQRNFQAANAELHRRFELGAQQAAEMMQEGTPPAPEFGNPTFNTPQFENPFN